MPAGRIKAHANTLASPDKQKPGKRPAPAVSRPAPIPRTRRGVLKPEEYSEDESESESDNVPPPSPRKGKKPTEGTQPGPTSTQLAEHNEDLVFIDQLTLLRDAITDFSTRYFDFKIKAAIEPAFRIAPPDLIRYIGCIALGGPNGREGWRQLIEDPTLRKAVVFGIISQALQHHVLASLCFGADPAMIQRLEVMEREQAEEDGFFRASRRAEVILASRMASQRESRHKAISRLTLQLERLLRPIRDLDYKRQEPDEPERDPAAYTEALSNIVGIAGILNAMIRANGDAVYYFQPVFKDMEFDPSTMHCKNLKEMQNSSPLGRDVDEEGNQIGANDPRGDPRDRALVRVVCSLGCSVFRPSGGDLARQILKDEEGRPDYSVAPELRSTTRRNEYKGRIITAEDGFRTKKLAKAIVALRWGRPQFEESPQVQEGYLELHQVQQYIAMDEQATGACTTM